MAWGSHAHRRSALALRRRSSAAGASGPVPDVHPRSLSTAINPGMQDNGDAGSNGPTDMPFNPDLLGLPGEPSVAPIDDLSTQPTSSSRASSSHVTSSSVAVKTTVPHTTTSIAHQVVPSTSSATSSGSHPGSIAGGVTVGVIALAALICLLVFFVRRSRRIGEEHFDASEFRRSAVLMSDPPTHEDTIARGFNPPPSEMTEHKHTGSPLSPLPNGYRNVTSGVSGNHDGHIIPPPQTTYSTPTSAPPSPRSYVTTSHSSGNGPLSAPPSAFEMKQQPSPRRASRPASGNDPGAANGFTFPRRQTSTPVTATTAEKKRPPKLILDQPPLDNYVDLSRSSVSPFQAAQYAEISRKLNTEVPRGLSEDEVDPRIVITESPTEATAYPPPLPPKSPFEDPEAMPESLRDSIRESFSSGQTAVRVQTPELQDFPVPPSPAATVTSRYRIDSMPPILPELNLDLRASGLAQKQKSVVSKYQPSPLASSADEATWTPQTGSSANFTIPKRPETVYDPADAYGGIQSPSSVHHSTFCA